MKLIKTLMSICRTSLQWVLNMNRFLNQTPNWQNKTHNVLFQKVLQKTVEEDGHTSGSFYWTLYQAKTIDRIGLDAWLKTEQAKGYTHELKKFLNNKI